MTAEKCLLSARISELERNQLDLLAALRDFISITDHYREQGWSVEEVLRLKEIRELAK